MMTSLEKTEVTCLKEIKKFMKGLSGKIMEHTPLAISTMIRLPWTSRPFKLYLASSASRGSLNS